MNHHTEITLDWIKTYASTMRHRSNPMTRNDAYWKMMSALNDLAAIIDQQEQTIAALQSTNQALLIGALS